MRRRGVVLVAALATLAGLVGATSVAASVEPEPKCAGGADATKVTVGIVEMVGCWTEFTKDGTKYYSADFAEQPAYGDKQIRGIDMNGFIVGGAHLGGAHPQGSRLLVNAKTYAIQSISSDDEQSTEPECTVFPAVISQITENREFAPRCRRRRSRLSLR